eukprot:scaffold93362_cov48-Prasinocladus_malaysianus.AAC.1
MSAPCVKSSRLIAQPSPVLTEREASHGRPRPSNFRVNFYFGAMNEILNDMRCLCRLGYQQNQLLSDIHALDR